MYYIQYESIIKLEQNGFLHIYKIMQMQHPPYMVAGYQYINWRSARLLNE